MGCSRARVWDLWTRAYCAIFLLKVAWSNVLLTCCVKGCCFNSGSISCSGSSRWATCYSNSSVGIVIISLICSEVRCFSAKDISEKNVQNNIFCIFISIIFSCLLQNLLKFCIERMTIDLGYIFALSGIDESFKSWKGLNRLSCWGSICQ